MTRKELLNMPLEDRENHILTQEEIKTLSKGYANTAEAVADWLGAEVTWEIIPENH